MQFVSGFSIGIVFILEIFFQPIRDRVAKSFEQLEQIFVVDTVVVFQEPKKYLLINRRQPKSRMLTKRN